jgi:hypothetical protein
MDIDDIDDPFAHGACVRPSLADSGAGVNLEGESDEDRGQVDPDELGDNQSESSGVVDDLLGGDGAPNLVSDAENEAWVALQQEEFETGAPPGMHAEGSEEPPGDDVQVLDGVSCAGGRAGSPSKRPESARFDRGSQGGLHNQMWLC